MNIWSISWPKTDREIFVCTAHDYEESIHIPEVPNLQRHRCQQHHITYYIWRILSLGYAILQYVISLLMLPRIQHPQPLNNVTGFLFDSWPVKMGPIGCPETSTSNYHYSLPNATLLHSTDFQPSRYVFSFIQWISQYLEIWTAGYQIRVRPVNTTRNDVKGGDRSLLWCTIS